MAETVCRSCAGAVAPTATACPHCGVTDPVAATTGPAPAAGAADTHRTAEPEPGTASRLKSAGKAIGCFVLALIVLAIALVVGLFDMVF